MKPPIVPATNKKMVRLTSLVSAICIAYAGASKTFATTGSWGIVDNIPRGGDASYSSVCEDVKSTIIEQASKEVSYFTLLHFQTSLWMFILFGGSKLMLILVLSPHITSLCDHYNTTLHSTPLNTTSHNINATGYLNHHIFLIFFHNLNIISL